jgi:formate C-acetyltransferase
MNVRLEELKIRARDGAYQSRQTELPAAPFETPDYAALSPVRKIARGMSIVCAAQQPALTPDERIVFTRTVGKLPPNETAGNICAAWDMALGQGLLARRCSALEARERFGEDAAAADFLEACVETIDAVLDMTARYAAEARQQGMDEIAAILERVPALPPRTFHEALQSLKILHSSLWLSGAHHVGLGRLDQYLWPYLKADLDAGRLTTEQAEELLAEFFISLNKDSHLYPGVQQGDDGQSLMLGGMTRDGHDAVNPLTWMVLRASCDVNMIDPKINLRVNGDTDPALLKEAARLTKRGLGFPQYANDDVEIDALIAHGYAPEDARDYTVAACWEFIISGRAIDVVNVGACSFPAAVDKAIRDGLAEGDSFDGILGRTRAAIGELVAHLVEYGKTMRFAPSPFYSVLLNDCLENGRDCTDGGVKYSNSGLHGAGSANAVDALAAVRKLVFEDKSVTAREFLDALESDFKDREDLRARLITGTPKVGNNDDCVDGLLATLFDYFAEACEAVKDNGHGGIVRPGSGSAMYYLWLARGEGSDREPVVHATADGRHDGDLFSASLAPSPGISVRGPISVLQSFSKIDYHRICNGGPITLELSDTVFRDDEGLTKVASLVRTFVHLGCQQLQLNTLNPAILRDAQAHPERHRNLIVRVWGWSGYFCELDKVYQDHIIARHVYD